MAEAEAQCASITVGGLASDLGMLGDATDHRPHVLGRLVEWCRIKQGMNEAQFAKRAQVDVEELRAIESGEESACSPRVIFKLAAALKLPVDRLMVLAGLAEDRDAAFDQATVRFAAQSSTAKLSKDQRRVLEEYVRVIIESSNRK
jgi:transcriptional regulator with XRE-family HTH domain